MPRDLDVQGHRYLCGIFDLSWDQHLQSREHLSGRTDVRGANLCTEPDVRRGKHLCLYLCGCSDLPWPRDVFRSPQLRRYGQLRGDTEL